MKYGRIERKREGEELESGWAVRGQKGSYGKDNARGLETRSRYLRQGTR